MEGNFAELVDGAARRRGLNDYQLSAAIGLLKNNRVFSSKQVNRLRTGQLRHHDDRELIARLIEVLHLSEKEADELWHAAGQWPPGLDLDSYRQFKHLAVVGAVPDQRDPKNGRSWRRAGERRKHDRRHLRVVPDVPVFVASQSA